METIKETPEQALERLGITVESVFVPFSQSRNKGEKNRSLNWRVTLKKGGKAIITTDYSAGIAHCPSYKQKLGGGMTIRETEEIEYETEKGFPAVRLGGGLGHFTSPAHKTPILPKATDVVSSLVMDSDAIEFTGFEEWADNCGYDRDSRSAEKIYRACLEIALQLRNGLGESTLAELREAFSDY